MKLTIKDNINKYNHLKDLILNALTLLKNIENNNDIKFNNKIDEIIDNFLIESLKFNDYYNKLNLYKLIFNISKKQNIKNEKFIKTINIHVIDTWRLLLLEINNDIYKILNIYLIEKNKNLGNYIQQLQLALSKKVNSIKFYKCIIKKINKLINYNIDYDIVFI